MKRLLLASLMGSAIVLGNQAMANEDLKALEQAARAEGEVNSVGMPDSWANWKDTWADLNKLYGLKHMDTDMSSAQEIAKFDLYQLMRGGSRVNDVQLQNEDVLFIPPAGMQVAVIGSVHEEAIYEAKAGESVGEMLAADKRPLWLSFTLKDEGSATLRSGESIEDAVAQAQKLGATALLFNCSAPEVMEDAVARARSAIGGGDIDVGVYANGFAHSETEIAANAGLREIRADLDPARYLEWARKWVAAGATMVGGCCGIGPQHIEVLAGGLR